MGNITKAPSSPRKDPSTAVPVCVDITAGICGFECAIRALKVDRREVMIELSRSECGQIKRLAEALSTLSLKEVFAPISRNPVYHSAEKSGCHPSCVIPPAVLKAAEVAMEMALPKDAAIHFFPCGKGDES